jgi:hypothetical protein
MQILKAGFAMIVIALVCGGLFQFVRVVSKLGLEGWLYMMYAQLNAAGDAVVEYKRVIAIYRGEVHKLVKMRAEQRKAIVESGL